MCNKSYIANNRYAVRLEMHCLNNYYSCEKTTLSRDIMFVSMKVYSIGRYIIRTLYTSHIMFAMLVYVFIICSALRVRTTTLSMCIIMSVLIECMFQNRRMEWRNKLEVYRMEQ